MDDFERSIHKAALQSLSKKLRNLELEPLHIASKKMSNGGLNSKLLHPSFQKNPVKSAATKLDRLYKE
jgi:hypothetical protein